MATNEVSHYEVTEEGTPRTGLGPGFTENTNRPPPRPETLPLTVDTLADLMHNAREQLRAQQEAEDERMRTLFAPDRLKAAAERRTRFLAIAETTGYLDSMHAVLGRLNPPADTPEALCVRMVRDTIAAFRGIEPDPGRRLHVASTLVEPLNTRAEPHEPSPERSTP